MGRIPESEYIEFHGCRVVTAQLIKLHHTPEEVEVFNVWLYGQTGIVMEDGTCGIYVYDYERWLEQGCRDRQCSHDWD